MIVDDRVRLFCVAAQVVDVEKKIDSAITECFRLGKHAVRTAMVPLPASGMIGTPTVSRIICEHVLQCFGFPKTPPEEVELIMKSIVMGNLRQFMTVSLTQFAAVSAIAVTAGAFTGKSTLPGTGWSDLARECTISAEVEFVPFREEDITSTLFTVYPTTFTPFSAYSSVSNVSL